MGDFCVAIYFVRLLIYFLSRRNPVNSRGQGTVLPRWLLSILLGFRRCAPALSTVFWFLVTSHSKILHRLTRLTAA